MPLSQGAMRNFHQKWSSSWAVLESASVQPAHLPVTCGDGFTAASLDRTDPNWQQQYIQSHQLTQDCIQPSFVYTAPSGEQPLDEVDSSAYLASGFTPSSASSAYSYTFLKSPGYRIVLEPGDRWQAIVHDNRFPGLSRSYSAEVTFGEGYRLEDLISKDPAFQCRHIHLFSMDKGRSIVYIGSSGLKGGSPLNWLGCEQCTWIFCFEDVWRCVCGYKCSDDSCWQHCNNHYQSHMCTGCRTVERCPKYYTCQTCHSTTLCSNCCGCYERQRQEEIREQARRAAARKADERERQQRQERERIRQQQEQTRLREQARREAAQRAEEAERQQRLRDQWARELEREREEQLRQQQERELQEQQERERQSVFSILDARLDSAPIDLSTSSHVDRSIVRVGISDDTDQEEAYTFIHQGSAGESLDSPSRLGEENLWDEDVPTPCSSSGSFLRLGSGDAQSPNVSTLCINSGSIVGLGSTVSYRNESTDASPEVSNNSAFMQFPPFISSRNVNGLLPPHLRRSSSNASVSSLASFSSASDDATNYYDASDQITILEPSISANFVDPPVTAVNAARSPDSSLIPSFLSNQLFYSSQDNFYQSVGKFVEEKLPQVEVTTQQEIIDFFNDEGVLDPYIVQHFPPSEWIVQTLLKEVVAYPDENDPSLNSFRRQWLHITEQYSISDQVSLLKSLRMRIKKPENNLSLLDINKIIDLVLNTGASGYAIVCSEETRWLSALKRTWLAPKLASLTRLTESEQDKLGCVLSDMDWGINMMDTFIKSVKDEVGLEPIMELISAIQAYKVPDLLVHPTITTAPTFPNKSKAKQWTHTITYHSLLYRIHRLSPQLARSIEQPLYNLLASSCSAQLLEKVVRDNLDLINAYTGEFLKVLELLYDYQVTEEVCALVFPILSQVAGLEWVDKIDQAVSSHLFQRTPQAYTTDELIERIAAASSAFNPEELRASYDAVVQSSRSPSVMLQSVNDPDFNKFKNKPISDWNQNQLSLWAKKVKSSHSSISQSELIAGVQHAVKLHHHFTPRDTQLLTLLILLNPTDNMGRLAQVNTGEGKSLIVAMLASIHGLQGKTVYVVTTSTELSIQEVIKQTPLFKLLSLTIAENSNMDTKLSAYTSDVVYGIASDFQADILHTEFLGRDIKGDRGFGIVIVDEVDSMFYDNRSMSVRLSEQTPGMIHLELPLGAIWDYLHRIIDQMTTIEDRVFFIPETFKRVGQTIELDSGEPWKSCAEVVSDKPSFITKKVQDHLEKLLRDLDGEEKSEYEAFKSLESKIIYLDESIANTTDSQEKEAKTESCRELLENLKSLPWSQRYPVLDVPVHLSELARFQIPYWIKSALNAAFIYKKGAHYMIQDNRIVPVNCNETGVLQSNMVLSDGLTQFLQIKEGLSMDPEGISTNFMSNISFFKKFGPNIYGLTGTLGEQSTKDFLHKMYHTDTVIIPPYQHRKIVDNATSPYLCKELRPIVLPDRTEWFQTIVENVLRHARHQRGVLIICKYICEVKYLYKHLCNIYDSKKIFLYTGEDSTFEKSKIDSGEIIIATNIAGRGTDLETSQSVESHGGMYVAVTFLPESYRVEMQNLGRTTRAGKKGMGQLIIYDPLRSDLEEIKKYRYEQEAAATGKAIQDAQRMLVQDRLFSEFCKLERQYLPNVKECDLAIKWKDLTKAWHDHASEALSPAKVAERVLQGVHNSKLDFVKRSLGSLSIAEASKLTEYDKRNYREKAARKAESNRPYFEEQYKKQVLNDFCNAQSHLPEELVTCLRYEREFKPNVSLLDQKYNWGLYDRKGFEEDWGIWLKGQHFEEQDLSLDEVLKQFDDGFATPSREHALKDKLVRNPYFYVLKGNLYLIRRDPGPAIACYDRAVGMDPDFSVNALYNKAHALLLYEKNQGERQNRAYEELKKAKKIIGTIARPALLTFSTFIAQREVKLLTSEHVQHQLNLLSQQENYIDKACAVIEEAREKKHHVKLAARLVSETLNKSDGDHSKAIRKASINGFTHLFTIERIEPIPWSSIVGLSLISLAQIIAGCLIIACTGGTLGTGLIMEGVFDMMTTVKSAIQGSFSWATQKAISLAVSLISCGIKSLKDGCRAIVNTTKDLLGKTAVRATKEGVKLASRTLGSALGKGVLKECLTAAGQFSTNKLFMEDLEKVIEDRVEASIKEAILKNPLVVQAMELDVKNGNNCYLNCFIEAGLSLMKDQKDHACLTMLREIGLGVAGKKISCFTPLLQTAGAAKMLYELTNYTNAFIDKFNSKVQSYQSDITSAIRQSQSTASTALSTVISSNTTHENLSYNVPPIDLEEADIVVDTAEDGTTYSSKKDPASNRVQKFYRNQDPSTPQLLVDAFKDQIAHKLTNSVKSNLVNPAINYGVNELTGAIFREIDQATAELSNKVRTARDRRHFTNELALEKARRDKKAKRKRKETNRIKKGKATVSEVKENKHLNKNVLQGIERINNDQPLDSNDLALAASALGAPIHVYDKETGELVDNVGSELPGKPITLQYNPGNGSGHWEPLDTSIKVAPTGANSCLIDAVFAQVSPDQKEAIQDVHSLRQKMLETLYNDPQAANKAYEIRDKLATIAPDQLRSGGWLLYDARNIYVKSKESVNEFLDQHTTLKKTIETGVDAYTKGSLVASCITNPVQCGLIIGGGWVADKACDFIVDKTHIYDPDNQEKLANFIQKIDPDFKREDAEIFAKDLTETGELACRFEAKRGVGEIVKNISK